MSRRQQVASNLQHVPLFGRCSGRDLKILARHIIEVEVPKGTLIVRQGDEGDAFYIVLSGSAKVRMLRPGSRGLGNTVNTLGPGSWFGELALLDSSPRNATVEAAEDCVVGVLDARAFRAILRDVPALTEKLLAGMARRIRDGDQRITSDIGSPKRAPPGKRGTAAGQRSRRHSQGSRRR